MVKKKQCQFCGVIYAKWQYVTWKKKDCCNRCYRKRFSEWYSKVPPVKMPTGIKTSKCVSCGETIRIDEQKNHWIHDSSKTEYTDNHFAFPVSRRRTMPPRLPSRRTKRKSK